MSKTIRVFAIVAATNFGTGDTYIRRMTGKQWDDYRDSRKNVSSRHGTYVQYADKDGNICEAKVVQWNNQWMED